ncbi:MAG: hydroxyethylthiazole kinase [Candidatus Competibacteraceae bacterium]|nr:hydroxyethylthiazole kinase [Candidatus Competibacteraceae bacterium]MBK7982969.1 hydroxyethylthiazole kinase [Candidatus Competibacteraceae bacterium]MBK8898479.1 hydroxyethylthiazole kinase [Candidatus Competibacteraceae bacterium]MBK8962289.1 hydroxyethylthiazole kinase [Candidatus Competibacteraceae bacterium]MBK9951507.1 hydroxyethylthiazole kinase [Candidatus Competibacteraceae bacterium]
MSLTAETIWKLLTAVRERRPLVHNITNFVVMNNTANALLALGASPAMVHSSDEVEDFVAISQALVVNIGTLYSEQIAAAKLAAITARAQGIPWILDPVGAGATPYRRAAAEALARLGPTVIRGNGSEILALAAGQAGRGKGVDSLDSAAAALDGARQVAAGAGAAVAITGAVDYVTDGQRVTTIENGHPLMARVTGLGCSATAVIGAFLAVERDAFTAAAAGLAVFGVAGEVAAERSPGPGSLQVALLDALYGLDETRFIRQCRCREITP